jgi:hypothetical protein
MQLRTFKIRFLLISEIVRIFGFGSEGIQIRIQLRVAKSSFEGPQLHFRNCRLLQSIAEVVMQLRSNISLKSADMQLWKSFLKVMEL